jgi:opacity protein-like surface antigen
MMFDLTGKVALVTGASRGIGRAIASKLASQGATVIAAARCDHAAAIASELSAQGLRAEAVSLDVTDATKIILNDYGSIRARGAWAYGNFLPYVLAGVTIAQINTSRSVAVSYAGTDVTPPNCPSPPNSGVGCINVGATYTQGDQSRGKYIFGFSAGLGIDYALTWNIFLRGEVEYLQLGSPNDIKLNTTSVRAGMGLKF